MAVKPIYFRVINEDLPLYKTPIEDNSKRVGKLEKGDIYAAFPDKTGWLKIDKGEYCERSPNHIVEIPVADIIELNGKYRVKDDMEVSGMSRKKSLDVESVAGRIIIVIMLSFIPIILFTLCYCWKYGDSSALVTLVGGYLAVITATIGLYIWNKKNNGVVALKKSLEKKDLDTSYAENLASEQESAEIDKIQL